MMSVRAPRRTNISFPGMDIQKRNGKYTALGFTSASMARKEGRAYSTASGDAYMRYDRIQLVNQSRAFYANNAIYKGMIDRAVDYIMGNGFTLQAKTGSPTMNTKVESLWKKFWRSPEIRGLLSGADAGELLCREVMLAGDCGVIKTTAGVCQFVEAEQIVGSGQIRNGIETDLTGRPVRYWISPYSDRGTLATSKARRYTPDDFLFVTRPDRFSSTRGVPACQSAFSMIHRINDVCDAEAIAWQLISRLAVSISREDSAERAYIESEEDPAKSGSDTGGELATRLTELEYALIFHANPGEKVEGIDHNIPGRNFGESLRMFLRLMGLPLGLPLELILLDWTKSNYSQSRAVLEQAYRTFLKWQQKIEDSALTPVLEWKISEWKRHGLLSQKKEIRYQWIKPTFPWIDQLKETKACGEKVDRSFMTHGEVCKSRGQDREEVCVAREQEIRDAIARSQKIKSDTGVKVPWELFAGLEVSKQSQVQEKEKENEPTDKRI